MNPAAPVAMAASRNLRLFIASRYVLYRVPRAARDAAEQKGKRQRTSAAGINPMGATFSLA
jgi:hypothetical protein